MFRLITQSLFILFLSLSSLITIQSIASEKDQPEVQLAILTVNINQASAEEIADVMTGIGIKKAEVIVQHRDKNGAFKSVEQLLEVKGIGPATIEKNRHKLKL